MAGNSKTITAQDERAISALLLQYATAADTRDRAMLEGCFAPDIKADYGDPIGSFSSRDEIVEGLLAMLSNCGETLHFITNITLRPDGADIAALCYTHAVVRLPGMDEPVRTAGTYTDRFTRVDGEWRIAERTYRGIA